MDIVLFIVVAVLIVGVIGWRVANGQSAFGGGGSAGGDDGAG